MRPILFFGIVLGLLALSACSSNEKEQARTSPDMALDSIPSLQAVLDTRKAEFAESAPAERVALYNKGVEDVAKSGVLETALRVGDVAPDFRLPTASGDSLQLRELLSEGPVVLTWYRGGWCPYCNLQLQALNAILPRFTAAGGQLVAISPEIPDSSLSTVGKNSLGFPVVSDAGNLVAGEYGVAYTLPVEIQDAFAGRLDLSAYNADSSMTLPLGATYIIDTDHLIKYAFVDPDYRKRAEPATLIAVLQELQAGQPAAVE